MRGFCVGVNLTFDGRDPINNDECLYNRVSWVQVKFYGVLVALTAAAVVVAVAVVVVIMVMIVIFLREGKCR